MASDSSSRSSSEYHDVVESTPDSSGFVTPPPEKKRLFGSLNIRKKKSPSTPVTDDDLDEWAGKAATLPKKGHGSLKRFLSFRKKSKVKRSKSVEKDASSETLCENLTVSSTLNVASENAPIASRETLTDETEISTPSPTKTEKAKKKNSKAKTASSDPKAFLKSKNDLLIPKTTDPKSNTPKPDKLIAEDKTLASNIKTTQRSYQLNVKSAQNTSNTSTESLEFFEVDENVPARVLDKKASFKVGSVETYASRDTINEIINFETDLTAEKGANAAVESSTEIIEVNPGIASRTLHKKTGIEVITLGSHTSQSFEQLIDPSIQPGRERKQSRFEVITSGASTIPSGGINAFPRKYPVKITKNPDEYISIAFLDIHGSRDTVEEDLVDASPTLQLRNALPIEAKKTPLHIDEDDSTESYKSAGSPELRNPPEEEPSRSVVVTRQGWPDSQSPDEASPPPVKTKKSLWKKLIGSKKTSAVNPDGLDGTMNPNPVQSKKEKLRGRSSNETKKETSIEKEIVSAVLNTNLPTASVSTVLNTPLPTTSNTDARGPTNGAQLKKGSKVSGDDLRKQLSEGLKNGAAKAKSAEAEVADQLKGVAEVLLGKTKDVKEQLSEITQSAATVSAVETLNFIEQEKKAKEAKDREDKQESKEGQDPDSADRAGVSASMGLNFSNPSASQQVAEMPATESKKEHLYKILVIGELGTGKTSIIKRYVHQFFSQHYRATIGVDFALKVLNWDENSIIRLQLWDIAGQERFGNMTRVYYKEAVGAFIVFDVTRAATFEAVQKWKQDLDSKVQLSDGSPIPCILLANKCDQPKEGIVNNKTKMDEYCTDNGFAGWFDCSAKDNINIEEAARELVVNILQNDKLRTGGGQYDADKIALSGRSDSNERSCNC